MPTNLDVIKCFLSRNRWSRCGRKAEYYSRSSKIFYNGILIAMDVNRQIFVNVEKIDAGKTRFVNDLLREMERQQRKPVFCQNQIDLDNCRQECFYPESF